MMLVPAASAASAAPAPVVKHVSVNSRRVYTDTGLKVKKGQTVTINASGFIHFGLRPIDHLAPAGMARISGCDELTGRKASQQTPRPAPRLDCWSLIGWIGAGGPFAVGATRTIKAPNEGELRLGVNDNYLRDNAGSWTATVTISTGSVAPAPVPTPAATKKSSSSTLMLMLGGVLVVAVLLGLVVFLRKRRASAEAGAAAPAVPAPAWSDRVAAAAPPPPAVRPVVRLPDGPAEAASHAVVVSPTEGDFTDVNIFEVEFPDNSSLRVGYNHFPEGTLVRFRIAQRARAEARGDFVTKGGGSQYHFVTVELDDELEANPNGADVTFVWDIGGVPFQYSVRRVTAR